MRHSRLLWRIIGIISVLTTCFFIVGFSYAIHAVIYPNPIDPTNLTVTPNEPQPSQNDEQPSQNDKQPSQNDAFTIVGLGDSLTLGTGDQSSFGYVRHVHEALDEAKDGKAKLINLAVSGYRSSQLLDDITERSGVIAAITQADIITLTIGGNDLFSIGDEVDLNDVQARFPAAIQTIEQIISKINELNPNAVLFYIGLYNPFVSWDDTGEISLLVQQWNDQMFKILNRYPQMTLVPTFDLFEQQGAAYLSSDHYHPNEAGYTEIAKRILQNTSPK